MKKVTSAIAILLASTMAMAVEPSAGTQSLVLAENTINAEINSGMVSEEFVSNARSAQVLRKTLNAVSAELTTELDRPFEILFAAQ
ncbi:hypothetical protein IB286_00930 [Spongiibacter sp. KMU-158]|uniref:Uncharacterized protein n=1 Tax=Spongiibacter pelagi TaxID=2760804 RepID=A0A927GUF5_9GAMM|nr:hypothetical protein [Spongiibacter pelagi]MBD2857551.1 hypothetical protein [Spongiibacter pelagi]